MSSIRSHDVPDRTEVSARSRAMRVSNEGCVVGRMEYGNNNHFCIEVPKTSLRIGRLKAPYHCDSALTWSDTSGIAVQIYPRLTGLAAAKICNHVPRRQRRVDRRGSAQEA
jgi:hypothetical protein